jgi:phosphoglycerol transferase MdoB-like AlkP superfamily enzyme
VSESNALNIAENKKQQKKQPRRSFGEVFKSRWGRQKPFRWWTYVIGFCLFDGLALALLQWSAAMSRPFWTFFQFLAQPFAFGGWDTIFIAHSLMPLLNLVLLGLVYFALVAIINRFWVATPIFVDFVAILALIERMKVSARGDMILPSDVQMAGTNGGDLMEFIPSNIGTLLVKFACFMIAVVLICIFISRFDARKKVINTKNKGLGVGIRILCFIAPFGFLTAFAASLGTVGGWSNTFASAIGDVPHLWSSTLDAQGNGTLMGFMRIANPKVMDEPTDYSEETMDALAAKYQQQADDINATRTENLTDNTVILVLSESYSDPNRVPGVKVSPNPMPDLTKRKTQTTSGLMLSSGYGGGTANLEFQALTGLSMANFDPSLSSPYQQLIPKLSWTPTFNQAWSEYAGGSLAFHPYQAGMYDRAEDYKKFGFVQFYTQDTKPYIQYQNYIDKNPYVDDESVYDSALNKIRTDSLNSQFLQLVTMQNHMPYNNYYTNNQFKVTSTGAALDPGEQSQIQTYAKGMSYTDQETTDFLKKLDAIDKPITVIWYGDHLPGIYVTAAQNPNNSVALHETDYFIWSNKASKSAGHKNPAADSDYTSPNFLMEQAAEHTDSKVSPYLALLQKVHGIVSAMEPPVVNSIQGWSRIPAGQALYLNSAGQQIDITKLDAADQQVLEDYKLVQYDITAGKGYLKDLNFMELPNPKN